ncbi:WD40 repeat domain-containing protein [Nostoc muscorum FACHB-395]|nr:WD40 repeat domain-containing protein [Desmonostoc muscorum FACHB-395]
MGGDMSQEFPSSKQNISNVSIGDSNVVTFNQTQILQISVAEIKTRQFIQTSPYKGLKKFESADKDLFFGRDQFLTGLVNELEQTNLILLLGASGSGKSSVVRAGLIPWLSQKRGSRLVNLTFTPDIDPFESFYASLLNKYKQTEAQIAREAKADTLTQVVERLKQPDDYWFILIDQFEELFTTSQPDKREQFLKSLVTLSRTKQSSVKIMGTMRADFLDRLSPYPQLVKATDKHRPLIAEMQLDELRLAIEQPAAYHGVVFETGLVEEIIKDIQGQAGYLPSLQYTLNLLWDTEVQTDSINDRTLNISTYRELGGVRGALQKHIDQIYSALLEPEKLATQRIFLKLVGIGGDSESSTEWKPVRRRANRFEFNDQLEQTVLVKLINENLLVSDHQPQAQESTVEIAHEILLTSWTTLNNWIKENRQAIALRNRLNDDVARWQAKKSEDELWSGSKLEKVLELREDTTFNQVLGGFSDVANQFIDASVGLRERQRRRIVIGLASFSTFALLLAGFAAYQWQSAERGKIEQTAITAKNQLSNYPLKALVTAISLVGQSHNPFLNFPNQSFPQSIKSSIKDSLFSAVEISREKNLFKGHQGSVMSVAISTDGQTILSGGYDGTVRLWNRNGQPLGEPFKGHQGTVLSVAISTDGQTILSGGDDGTVRLWNRNGQPLGEPFKGHQGTVHYVAISTDGQTILSGGDDGTVRLWNRNGQPLGEPFKGHQSSVASVAISTDGQTILSGDSDGTVRLWNRNGQPLGEPFKCHQGSVYSVAISTDGQTILSGGSDGTVRLWNRNGQPLGEPFKGHQGTVYYVAISTDGQTILSGGSDGTVRLWNRNGQPLGEPFKGHQGSVYSVAISTDGQTILSGGSDGTVRLWNSQGQPLGEPFKSHQGYVTSVAISTDGQTILSGGDDGTVRLWNSQGQPLGEPFKGHQDSVNSEVAISTDGQTILSGDSDGTVRLWNRNGQPLGEPFKGHQSSVASVAISTDGQTILSGGGDGTVRLWNRNGQPLGEPFKGHQGPVLSVAISTDGQTILSGGKDGTVRLWNRNGQPLGEPFKGHQGYVKSVAISTGGQTILSGGKDGTVRLWNRNGQPLGEPFKGHKGAVLSVAISTDGQTILSGGGDGTVRLWNSQGQPLGEPFKSHQDSVTSVAISTDGQTILSGGDDGTVRLWDIRLDTWLKAACERLKDHPVFTKPESADEKEAKATCQPYLR